MTDGTLSGVTHLDDAHLDHLAGLARVALAVGERDAVRADLERVLDYVARLAAFDDPAVAPLRHPAHDGAPLEPAALRADVAPASDEEPSALDPALERREGRVVVPRTVDVDG